MHRLGPVPIPITAEEAPTLDTPTTPQDVPPPKCPFAFLMTRRALFGAGAGLAVAIGAAVYLHRPPPTLAEIEAAAAYDLAAARSSGTAPRAIVRSLAPGLSEITDSGRRKDLFFRIVLPLILHENERRRSPLKKIPVSLAMAQAAIESGWGTARFAVHGNALYGQRSYAADVAGIRPSDGDGIFKVRVFETLGRSVSAYFRNLNTHPRYQDFRRARKILVDQGKAPGPFDLLPHLLAYSEEGVLYLAKVARVIADNRLEDFDRVRLE